MALRPIYTGYWKEHIVPFQYTTNAEFGVDECTPSVVALEAAQCAPWHAVREKTLSAECGKQLRKVEVR